MNIFLLYRQSHNQVIFVSPHSTFQGAQTKMKKESGEISYITRINGDHTEYYLEGQEPHMWGQSYETDLIGRLDWFIVKTELED